MNRPAPPPLPAAAQTDRIWFTERLPLGIQFSERMSGYVAGPVDDPDEKAACRKAAERGERAGWRCDGTFTIVSDDLEAMLSRWQHEAGLVGTITVCRLSETPMTVREGRFRLFEVCADRVETRRMWYRMTVTPDGGATTYYLQGYKEVRNSLPSRAWADLTTLYLTISTGNYGHAGKVIAQGILRLSLGDFLWQLTTFRARHAQRFVERLDAPARFIGFFAGILLSTYGRVLAPSTVATPDAPPPGAPRGRVHPQQPIRVTTSDGVAIYLTRCRGGSAGPVMLVPGFTTVAASFDTSTVETNLVQYLCAKGFDVWLLDYRASPISPAAWTSFTIDDIARRDYPAAVQAVLDRTGAKKVQILAHCVGSISLFMFLLDGQLDGRVRSVICSQVAAHMVTALATQVKSRLFLAALLRLLRVRQISASFDPRVWRDWTLDQLLKLLYPTDERCNNPVCRRLLFIFHEIYRHEQLNTDTHDALWQWFGTSNMAALRHLSLIVRTGHVVDAEGQEAYLPHLDRLKLPISFMHGALNRVFPPAATRTTYEELCRANGPAWYRWKEFQGYNHMDCFIGRNAAQHVFPWIVQQLQEPPHP